MDEIRCSLSAPERDNIGSALGTGCCEYGRKEIALVGVRLDRLLILNRHQETVWDAAGQAPAEGAGQARVSGSLAEELRAVLGRGTRLLGGQEGGSDLHALRSEGKCGGDPVAVCNAAGGDDWLADLRDGGPNQGQRADQGVLGLGQKSPTMTARFGAGGDDYVHSGLVQGDCLVWSGGGPDRANARAVKL